MRHSIIRQKLIVLSRFAVKTNVSNIHRMLSTSGKAFDHYKTLGVTNNATSAEIKENYLKKCKEYHPDKHQGNASMHEKFVKINDAYSVLSDSAKKREYDMRFNASSTQRNRSQHAWGYRNTSSGPEDVWKQAYYKSSEKRSRTYNNYENPYEYWRNSQSYQQNNADYRNRTYKHQRRDPLFDYWDSIYNTNKKSHPRNRTSSFKTQYQPSDNQEPNKIVAIFLVAIMIVLWVRYWFAMRTLSSNSQYYQKPYYEREDDITQPQIQDENKPKKDGKAVDDLNLKTESA